MSKITNNIVDFKNPTNQAEQMGVTDITDIGMNFSTGSYEVFIAYDEMDKVEWDIIDGVFTVMIWTKNQNYTDRSEMIIRTTSIDSFIDGILEIQQKLPKDMLIVGAEHE